MDTTASSICKESFIKEKKFRLRWEKENKERAIAEGREYEPEQVYFFTPRGPSAAMSFLDQTLGLKPPPKGLTLRRPGEAQTARGPSSEEEPVDEFIELLGKGVSKEGQGKAAYLKARTCMGPQEKYGRSVTSSQEVGWTAPTITTNGSPFAHKPIIRDTFFRSNGVFAGR